MARPSGPLALLGSGEFEPWTEPVDRRLLGEGSESLVGNGNGQGS